MSGETQKAKRRLTNISFEHDGAHVALVGKAVGGPANGRTTLITKSTNDITDVDVKQKLESIEKAKFYQELRQGLEEKLRDQFRDKLEYSWLYLEDFSDSEVIFSTDGNMYSATYELVDDNYVISSTAQEVNVKRVYVVDDKGEILISKSAKEDVESGVYKLLEKSLENPETVKRASNMLKSIREKETKKMDEIQKAVDAANAVSAVKIEELTKQLADAVAKVDSYVVAEKAAKLKARETALTDAVGADKAVAIAKGAEALTDEAFAALVETFKGLKAVDADLLKQQSGEGAEQDVTKGSQTADILKARFAQ